MEKMPIMEQEKRVTPEEILHEFGFKEGEAIPASKVREMILRYEKELTEGLARNYYHAIKSSLFRSRFQPIRSPYYLLKQEQHRNREQERQFVYFMWFLETEAKEGKDVWSKNDEYKVVFIYSVDQARIDDEEKYHREDSFTGYDAFHMENILIGDMPLGTFNARKDVRSLPNIHEVRSNHTDLSYENIRVFLERALRPPETFVDAEEQIEKIWDEHHFPEKDAKALKQAIWEFGNHDFLEREGFRMVGSCLAIPLRFVDLVKERYGIELLECELTGAHNMRQDYSAEELAELADERAETAVHNATIYKKTVIIDWTSRQLDKRKPIPEIVDITKHPRLQERIEIYEMPPMKGPDEEKEQDG